MSRQKSNCTRSMLYIESEYTHTNAYALSYYHIYITSNDNPFLFPVRGVKFYTQVHMHKCENITYMCQKVVELL
jgi:hypothetical protein